LDISQRIAQRGGLRRWGETEQLLPPSIVVYGSRLKLVADANYYFKTTVSWLCRLKLTIKRVFSQQKYTHKPSLVLYLALERLVDLRQHGPKTIVPT
jgi:hypothetical protein